MTETAARPSSAPLQQRSPGGCTVDTPPSNNRVGGGISISFRRAIPCCRVSIRGGLRSSLTCSVTVSDMSEVYKCEGRYVGRQVDEAAAGDSITSTVINSLCPSDRPTTEACTDDGE